MTNRLLFLFVYGICAAVLGAAPAYADRLEARPSGFNEVPLALSTPAIADFRATLNRGETQIDYELTYSGFMTSVTQAHLHLGKQGANGGIMVFLCSNLGNGPTNTPACPAFDGTVTGVVLDASVVGPSAQGITPYEFAELVEAIRAHAAYVNIHTEAFPTGELRDQVDFRRQRDRD